MGFPSAFLFAGIPALVSSLWATSDVSTAQLMVRLYEVLTTTGRGPTLALIDNPRHVGE